MICNFINDYFCPLWLLQFTKLSSCPCNIIQDNKYRNCWLKDHWSVLAHLPVFKWTLSVFCLELWYEFGVSWFHKHVLGTIEIKCTAHSLKVKKLIRLIVILSLMFWYDVINDTFTQCFLNPCLDDYFMVSQDNWHSMVGGVGGGETMSPNVT